ncbi:MAG: hypothetical protein HDKAJFGB_03806 [Anaerolineae bacterium]|nr:hypothetical protein [Anaerolineae bacterium]
MTTPRIKNYWRNGIRTVKSENSLGAARRGTKKNPKASYFCAKLLTAYNGRVIKNNDPTAGVLARRFFAAALETELPLNQTEVF